MVSSRPGMALARAAATLPALLLALLSLRLVEFAHAVASGLPFGSVMMPMIENDLLATARYSFVLVLLALPLGFIGRVRPRVVAIAVLWSFIVLVQAGLLQYVWTAGVPLGADLFAYSASEVGTTVGGARPGAWMLGGLVLALAVLWRLLLGHARHDAPPMSPVPVVFGLVVSLLCFGFAPERVHPAGQSDAAATAALNKVAYFVDNNLAKLVEGRGKAPVAASGKADAGTWAGPDPRYPFVHEERTPDTLGEHFNRTADGTPPRFVFIIVEGLGRNFSGTGARFGSFTPFLDDLAQRSLYFENFVAPQGRTFGVLPSLFASLPFGENGFSALGKDMPAHASLPSILKANKYQLRYYVGTNLEFDNQGLFLQRAGFDKLVSEKDFGEQHTRYGEWGYADSDLMNLAIEREKQAPEGPALSVVQTTSMHSPFNYPDKSDWQERVAQHVQKLGIARDKRQVYADHSDIFGSVLYTDNALRRFFEQAKSLPGYASTIFILTGDHRLPELPMDTRIERYHVPLIVFSPLLKEPKAIKSLSSQFDLAPSLLAYLGKQYGIATPAQVTWLGSGLDLDPGFRNVHAFALKQTKTEMSDFISGASYLAQGRIYSLTDGMQTDLIDNPETLAKASAQFDAFKAANSQFARDRKLAAAAAPLQPFSEAQRSLTWPGLAAEPPAIEVTATAPSVVDGTLVVAARFSNRAPLPSPPFVPLLVLVDASGREIGEIGGAAVTLEGRSAQQVTLRLKPPALPEGEYFVAMIPSHPDTGKAMGTGQYHVSVRF